MTTMTPPSWTESDRLAALARYNILDTPREANYDDIVALVANALDVPIAVVNLIAEGRQWFKAEVGLGIRETPLDTSFCARAILQPGGMVVPDARDDPAFQCNPLVTGEPGLRFYAGELLETPEGLPLGTLCVLDTKPRPHGLSAQQRFLLRTLARQVMVQLELRRAVTEREFALAEQYRQELFQRQLQDSVVDHAIIGSTLDGRIQSWNAGAANIFGWSRDEAVGQKKFIIFTPEDIAAGQPQIEMRRALETGRSPDERWHIRKDGSRFWASGAMTVVRDDAGAAQGFVKIVRDQTATHLERKKLEDAQERLRLATDTVGLGIFVWYVQEDRAMWENDRLYEIFGVTPDEGPISSAQFLSDFIYPDDAASFRQALTRTLETGERFHFEVRFYRRDDKRLCWAEITGLIEGAANGHSQRMLGTVADITDRKQTEARLLEANMTLEEAFATQTRLAADLRTSEERLQYALEGVGDGVWDWQVDTNAVFFSKRWKQILGYGDDEVKPEFNSWANLVHSADLSLSMEHLNACLEGRSPVYTSEVRMWSKSSQWVWIRARGTVVSRSKDGKPRRMVGTITDITETKALSRDLEQSHDLLTRLTQQVPGLLYQFKMRENGELSFPYLSAMVEEIFELTAAEIQIDVRLAFARVHEDDIDGLMQSIEESAASLQPWNHLFRMRLPRQGLRWREGNAKPTRLEDGSTLWHGFLTDVSG